MMLVGRLLQGLGISGPRTVTMAIVRDRYKGRLMARVMSFAMTIFILVPMIAPSMGQAVLQFTGWRGIFIALILFAVITMLWFGLRMPETLDPERRSEFSLRRILNATKEIIGIRTAIGYTISTGLIGGAFLGYLNSAQQIFAEQYGLGDLFPIIFAIISGALGLASFLNSRLVMRYGMRFLVIWSMRAILVLGIIGFIVASLAQGQPPLWVMITYLMLTFFSIGILFGNQNSLAMEPLGHLAGMGAAIIGALSTLIQMPLGTMIGRSYNGTVLPLIIGIALMAILSIIVVTWVEQGSDPEPKPKPGLKLV
jgi:DHA1 family bicyclomycin/chloramphenicol resistance-like MFS transporter